VDWWLILILFLGFFVLLMFLGLPVFFSFLVVNIVTVTYVIGFSAGMKQMVLNIYDSLANFSLSPIPFFVLMGEILFHSGLVIKCLDVLSSWFGRIPGRLSVVSIASGTLFATMSGSSIANTSMFGSLLVPEMHRRGYHPSMSVGPVLASGSLAMIIPPSAIAVLWAAIAQVPVGDLLIAGFLPGILMALVFVSYIIIRCLVNPALAPAYEMERIPWSKKVNGFFKYVFPLFFIVLLVLGSIFSGVATPTESAAFGAAGSILLVAAYGLLDREVIRKSLTETLKVTGMIFMIIASAAVFSQLLAYTGATREMIQFLSSSNISGMTILILMLLIVIILGCFMEQVSIMMITIPLFMPIVQALGFDPIWFGILMLICLDLGYLTPPFGLLLFVMKSVSPKEITLAHIIRSALPFIALEVLVVLIIMLIPEIALWLPSIE
jgi:tripartite ATP-independent transporter DctM subunit